MRIATWNLDRSGVIRKGRIAGQVAQIEAIKADVWILTETHRNVSIPGFQSVASVSSGGIYAPEESAAAIWVPASWSLAPVPVRNDRLSVCAVTQAPDGADPLLIYATIIPYRMDGVRSGAAQAWQRHREAIALQTSEWKDLSAAHPGCRLCVGGDFNMTLDSNRGYGIKEGRAAIRQALEDLKLQCPTAVDLSVLSGGQVLRRNVDHICVDGAFTLMRHPIVWSSSSSQHGALSDHNGIAIDVE